MGVGWAGSERPKLTVALKILADSAAHVAPALHFVPVCHAVCFLLRSLRSLRPPESCPAGPATRQECRVEAALRCPRRRRHMVRALCSRVPSWRPAEKRQPIATGVPSSRRGAIGLAIDQVSRVKGINAVRLTIPNGSTKTPAPVSAVPANLVLCSRDLRGL